MREREGMEGIIGVVPKLLAPPGWGREPASVGAPEMAEVRREVLLSGRFLRGKNRRGKGTGGGNERNW